MFYFLNVLNINENLLIEAEFNDKGDVISFIINDFGEGSEYFPF